MKRTITSANPSGQSPAYTSEKIKKYFSLEPKIDLFLDAGALPQNPPSTVVDLTKYPPKILRQGLLSGLEKIII